MLFGPAATAAFPVDAYESKPREDMRGVSVEVRVRAYGPGQLRSGASAGAGVRVVSVAAPTTIAIGSFGQLVGLSGGGRCVSLAAAVPTGEEEARALSYINQYGVCQPAAPGEPAPTGQQAFDPAAAALAVWRDQLPLPSPDPHIAPGWALTGKHAFLETNSSLDPLSTSTDTVIGPLEIRATSVYRVDWGDGTVEQYDVEGGPWPDGDIKHLYQQSAVYDVTVEQVYSAEWRLGGFQTWQPIPLTRQRSGTIEDFVVQQVQAVRDR